MKKNIFLIFILFSFLFSSQDSIKLSYKRLALSGIATAGAIGASYFVMRNTWWSENSTDFHFDNGADLHYAKNLDKAGHLYGGYITQDLYYRSLVWSGVGKNSALCWSAGLGIFDQIMIDLKDGYAPRWGFSMYDVLAGTAGSGYGALQKIYPVLEDYDLKFSYYKRKDNYGFSQSGRWMIEELIEDYPNQTYWLTANINAMLPEMADRLFPDYLGLAFGVSVDDGIGNKDSGEYELYLSLDLDLEKIVEPLNNSTVSSIAHYLNYIKFPAPALKFYPGAKGYWLYM